MTTPEPLPADDPLWQAPNLLVVPHIGSATWSARERMTEIAVENILAGLEGKPLPYQVPAQTLIGGLSVRIAVVDVGTNTTRLYLAEVADGAGHRRAHARQPRHQARRRGRRQRPAGSRRARA